MSNTDITSRLLSRAEAAKYIKDTYAIPCVATTLAKYAVFGVGPAYRKAGNRTFYAKEDLDTWANARMSEPMTKTKP
jgi:hypothetical protein